MSSKPSSGGVKELVLATEELAEVEASLRVTVPERDRLVAEVASLESRRAAASERLQSLLRAMDVEATGNFGWEGRFGWLLGEFRRQLLSRAGVP